jgi:curli biogenesis system outer membrane secretion channel CsgG
MKHLLLLAFLLAHTISVSCQETLVLKKRIAIAPFKNAIVSSVTSGSVSENIFTDNLTTELVNSGQFEVYERTQIDAITDEQKLGESDLLNPQSAAKIGQMLGVEIIVIGSITEYGVNSTTEITSIGPIQKKQGKSVAKVVVDIRLISTSSGQVLIAKTAAGIDTVKTEVSGILGIGKGNVTDDKASSDEKQLNKAKARAISNCVAYISEAMQNVRWSGKVILTKPDGFIFIKPGLNAGVQIGTEFIVFGTGQEIIDPDTGISLGSDEIETGKIKVSSYIGDGQACKAKIVSGKAKKGDIIRLP